MYIHRHKEPLEKKGIQTAAFDCFPAGNHDLCAAIAHSHQSRFF